VPDLRPGDAQLIDLRDNPVVSLDTPFDSLRFYIPQMALDEIANEAEIRRVKGLYAPNFGGRLAKLPLCFLTVSHSFFSLTLCTLTAASRSEDGTPAAGSRRGNSSESAHVDCGPVR
jgi:hypothetical protein